MTVEQDVQDFSEKFTRVREEVAKVIVGQEDVVEGVLSALLVGGHVLLEGVPGLGKTMLVRSLSDALHLQLE